MGTGGLAVRSMRFGESLLGIRLTHVYICDAMLLPASEMTDRKLTRIPSLHADTFKPSRSHKAAMAALRAFVRQPEASSSSSSSHTLQDCHPGKGKYSRPWDVEREWDLVQWDTNDGAMERSLAKGSESETNEAKKAQEKQKHIERSRAGAEERAQRRAARQRGEKDQCWWTDLEPFRSGSKRRHFTTSLALATSTEEKYQLFRRYQMQVHGESDAKVSTMQGFERFLCKSPVRITMPSYNSDESVNGKKAHDREDRQTEKVVLESTDPIAYGLYHMEYRCESSPSRSLLATTISLMWTNNSG